MIVMDDKAKAKYRAKRELAWKYSAKHAGLSIHEVSDYGTPKSKYGVNIGATGTLTPKGVRAFIKRIQSAQAFVEKLNRM